MKYSTLLAPQLFISSSNALIGWWGCPDIPPLDDGSEDRAIDQFGRVSHANSVDLELLKDTKWYELMRDMDFDSSSDCVDVEFIPFSYDSENKVFAAVYVEHYENEGESKVTNKYDMKMGSTGIGYLDYFADSWLWGDSLYNVIQLDY